MGTPPGALMLHNWPRGGQTHRDPQRPCQCRLEAQKVANPNPNPNPRLEAQKVAKDAMMCEDAE